VKEVMAMRMTTRMRKRRMMRRKRIRPPLATAHRQATRERAHGEEATTARHSGV